MDELEREFRAALGHLADGPEPSDDLVGRTVERSAQIRRHRRVLTVAGTAGALVVMLAIVSVAGAATRRGQVEVAGPGISDDSTTTTVTTLAPVVIPASTTTNSRPTSTTVPLVVPTTSPTRCVDEPVVDDPPTSGSFTLLPSGNIEVSYAFPFGPARESHYYILDDGTSGSGGFTKEYTPDEFGTHWYKEWAQLPGYPEDLASCKTQHNFVVDPSVVTPTTTSEPTTSVPVETTIPASDTTIPIG